MLFVFPALAAVPFEVLTKLTELLAAHCVYALVVFFLFYQQRRALQDLNSAKPDDFRYFRWIHASTVWVTYGLIAIAIPVWIYATFIYRPKTVVWGNVAHLTQMPGEPTQPGQVFIDQQVTPEQPSANFYENKQTDRTDATKVTVYWALVEDGQYTQIPLILSHRYKEIIPAGAIPRYPNDPYRAGLRDIPQRCRFVVKLSQWTAIQSGTFDYQYDPDGSDPEHKLGRLRLLRNGVTEDVTMVPVSAGSPQTGISAAISWPFGIASVFAQGPGQQQNVSVPRNVILLLGSADLKQQLTAEEILSKSPSIPWVEIQSILEDPKAPTDRFLLVHNLVNIIKTLSFKGVKVPAPIRLDLAKASYESGDFKTATLLFNGLSDAELGADASNYYFRGVSNLQTGDYSTASKNLTTYVNKAPSPSAKVIGQKTLSIAKERQQIKK